MGSVLKWGHNQKNQRKITWNYFTTSHGKCSYSARLQLLLYYGIITEGEEWVGTLGKGLAFLVYLINLRCITF